jgi:hypothetical protein
VANQIVVAAGRMRITLARHDKTKLQYLPDTIKKTGHASQAQANTTHRDAGSSATSYRVWYHQIINMHIA